MLSDPELVEALQRALFRDPTRRLLAVYVFGSAASGREHPGSDLDIAFLADASPSTVETFDAAQELAALVHRDVDLIDLRGASTVMRAQVIGSGRRVFEADATRVGEFEMYALSDYARLNEERRGAVESFLERYRA